MNNKDIMLGGYISQLYRLGSAFISKKLAKFNIGYGQFAFLMYLYKNECICQEELTEILCIDKGTTARAIKKLEEEGYIIREKAPYDRRSYKISLTHKAREIEAEIRKILEEWNKQLTSNLTEEEVNLALELMAKITTNQRRCIGKE